MRIIGIGSAVIQPSDEHRFAPVLLAPFAGVEVKQRLDEAEGDDERADDEERLDTEYVLAQHGDDGSFRTDRQAGREHQQDVQRELSEVFANSLFQFRLSTHRLLSSTAVGAQLELGQLLVGDVLLADVRALDALEVRRMVRDVRGERLDELLALAVEIRVLRFDVTECRSHRRFRRPRIVCREDDCVVGPVQQALEALVKRRSVPFDVGILEPGLDAEFDATDALVESVSPVSRASPRDRTRRCLRCGRACG